MITSNAEQHLRVLVKAQGVLWNKEMAYFGYIF